MVVLFTMLSIQTIAAAAAAEPEKPVAAEPHAHLQQILQRPLFKSWRLRQEEKDSLDESSWSLGDGQWRKDLSKAIRDFFDWLFRSNNSANNPNLPHSSSALPAILKAVAWAIVVIGVLALLAVLIRVMTKSERSTAAARVLTREQIRAAMEAGDALALGTSEWMSEADRLVAEQDFRAVYRALYLALLSGLHTAGKIEHSLTRTNWTYVQRYRGPADERDTFGNLTALFDRVWYGRKPADGDDLPSIQQKVSTLTNATLTDSPLNRGRSPA